jgi:hypothetical protein
VVHQQNLPDYPALPHQPLRIRQRLEFTEAFVLEKNPNVAAWVKNDHLGFEIVYVLIGVVRKYYLTSLFGLKMGECSFLKPRGSYTVQVVEKRKALMNGSRPLTSLAIMASGFRIYQPMSRMWKELLRNGREVSQRLPCGYTTVMTEVNAI